MRILLLLAIGCATTVPTVALADKAKDDEAARHQAMAHQAQQADANVASQLKSIETKLKQEEQRMNARLAQLAKMRDAALKKGNQQDLKRVEQLEMQAVKQYDTRVTQIIGAAPGEDAQPANSVAGAKPGRLQTRQVSRNQQQAAPLMQAPGKQQATAQHARNQRQQQVNQAQQKAQQSSNQQRAPKRSKRLKLWPF